MDTNVNRKHKDSVFSMLFGSPEILRELYSAIEGVEIPQDAIVDINTLSDALFMTKINDLSFTINDRIVVLIEHQSTISQNIPLRLLMYIARVYEKIIESKNIYHRKLIKIPTPEFIVLYNGKENYPEHQVLRLSAAFKNISGLKLLENTELPLELAAHTYNINPGHNSKILEKCITLNNYSILIGKINEYNVYMPLAEAIKKAVLYCIEHNILREFLESNSSEVFNMLTDDITIEEIADIRYEEGREDGLELGIEQGQKNVFSLLDQGLSIEEIKQRLTQTTTR